MLARYDGTQLVWEHYNPVTGSSVASFTNGGGYQGAELDPMGGEAGTTNPYVGGGGTPEQVYALDMGVDEHGVGTPSDPQGGCLVNGFTMPCEYYASLQQNGGLAIEDNRLPVDGGMPGRAIPLSPSQAVPGSKAIWVDDPGRTTYERHCDPLTGECYPVPTAYSGGGHFVNVGDSGLTSSLTIRPLLSQDPPGPVVDRIPGLRLTMQQQKNYPCAGGKASDLDYYKMRGNRGGGIRSENGIDHITRLHILLDNNGGVLTPSKTPILAQSKSKYLFQEGTSLQVAQQAVMNLNAYVFNHGRPTNQDNGNIKITYTFLGAVTDNTGKVYAGIGFDKKAGFLPTMTATLILASDCREVVTSFPGK